MIDLDGVDKIEKKNKKKVKPKPPKKQYVPATAPKKRGPKPHIDTPPEETDTVLALQAPVHAVMRPYTDGILDRIEGMDFETDMVNYVPFINDVVFAACPYKRRTVSSYYSAEELSCVYDYFREILLKVSLTCNYTPTLNTFCNFINIRRSEFVDWTNQNNDRGRTAAIIKQDLEEGFLQGILSGKVRESSGVFIAKSVFALREQDQNGLNIINISTEKSVDEILAEFDKNIVRNKATDI